MERLGAITDFTGKIKSSHRNHSPGTLQSSKINSDVLEPLIPSLSSLMPVLNPGIPFQRIKIHIIYILNIVSAVKKTQSIILYLLHNKSCDSMLRGCRQICLGIHNESVGIRSVGDPKLGAIQYIIVPWKYEHHTLS